MSLPVAAARVPAGLVLAALAVFIALALFTQFARPDLDWVQATLSLYLHGPWGLALRSAYCLLAAAIVVLGVAMYRVSTGPRRSAAAPLLFGMAAVGLAGVAVCESWLPEAAPLLAPLVHAVAANMAFLCVSVALLLQTWYLRREPGWHRSATALWAGAWLGFILLWAHVLWRAPPRGLGQKLVIAVIVACLLGLALGLRQRATAAATPHAA